MSDDFDPLGLARAPKLDVPGALALSLRLLGAAPDNPTHAVRSALDVLRQARAELAGRSTGFFNASRSAGPGPGPGSTRLADDEAALAWRALHARLESYTQLPSDRYPNASRAAALIARLFPTGLEVFREPAPQRLAELRRRYSESREADVALELEEVAGSDFIDALHRAMAVDRPVERRVESRLRVATPTVTGGAVPEAVAESLRALRRAIASYLLQLVAMHDEGNSAARIAVRSAFRPVAELEASGLEGGAPSSRRPPRPAAMRHAG